jgi:hypothetical protein
MNSQRSSHTHIVKPQNPKLNGEALTACPDFSGNTFEN